MTISERISLMPTAGSPDHPPGEGEGNDASRGGEGKRQDGGGRRSSGEHVGMHRDVCEAPSGSLRVEIWGGLEECGGEGRGIGMSGEIGEEAGHKWGGASHRTRRWNDTNGSIGRRAMSIGRFNFSLGDGGRCGLRSGIIMITCLIMAAAPVGGTIPAPVNMVAAPYGDVTVRLQWEAANGWSPSLSNSTLDKWVTWRSTSPDSGYTVMDTSLLGPITFKVVSALQAGVRYYFRVEAYSCCNLLKFQAVCTGKTVCEASATTYFSSPAYPTNGYAQVSIVAKTFPSAPTAPAMTIGPASGGYPGTASVELSWKLPLDTGGGTSLR